MDLIDAAKHGDLAEVLSQLETGYGANTRDKDNATALYWSACHGHNDVSEVLISAGCDVNATVRWGSTALHAAADRGHVQCAQLLIHSGARTHCTNDRGDTPLHIAAYRGFLEITRMLLLAGSDVTIINGKGKTPQEEAMEGGNTEVAECIRLFVREGQFSLRNGGWHTSSASLNNGNGNGTIFCNTQTNSMLHSNIGRLNSLTSDYSTDVTDSTTSSAYNSSSSFPEDSVDSWTEPEAARRQTPMVHLQRSLSFGGTHNSHKRTSSHPIFPDVPRTASAESVQCIIPPTTQMVRNNDVIMKNSKYNSLSMGGLCVSDKHLNATGVLTNGSSSASNQNHRTFMRSGLIQEDTHHRTNELVLTLQNQIVEAYRQIENLTNENENLKFKSSTLLERLNTSEGKLSSKTETCEVLTDLLETERCKMRSVTNDAAIEETAARHDSDIPLDGFKELANRFVDSPDQLETRLMMAVRSISTKYSKIQAVKTKEWLPGIDYVILGDPSIRTTLDDRIPGFASFLIKHLGTNQCYILKMVIRIENSSTTHSSFTQATNTETMTTGYNSVPNILKVLYQYESSTDRLKKFVCIPTEQDTQLPQQVLVKRTAFLVTPCLLTLSKLIDTSKDSELVYRDSDLRTLFWIQVLYQLTSILCLVEDKGLTYGEMDTDSIEFDEGLVPYLYNIENVVGTNECSLTNGSRIEREDTTVTQLNQRPSDPPTDAARLCKLFSDLICVSTTGNEKSVLGSDSQQGSPIQQPFRRILADAAAPMSYLFGESNTARNISKRFGFMLFSPTRLEMRDENECFLYHQSHMLKLLAQLPLCKRSTGQYGVYTSMEESVHSNRCRIEAHFLSNVTSRDLWKQFQTFEQKGLLKS